MCEHAALNDKMHRIHAVLSAPQPDQNEVDALLREFLTTLAVHFSSEENCRLLRRNEDLRSHVFRPRDSIGYWLSSIESCPTKPSSFANSRVPEPFISVVERTSVALP